MAMDRRRDENRIRAFHGLSTSRHADAGADSAPSESATSWGRGHPQSRNAVGLDGPALTWVAHPDLVPYATNVFDSVLGTRPNQKDRKREEVQVTALDLLHVSVPGGRVTEAGVRANVSVLALPRQLARRLRRGCERSNRRDLAVPALAVARPRHPPGQWPTANRKRNRALSRTCQIGLS